MASSVGTRPAVSRSEWLAARKALLVREKELTHAREELAEARRALPRVRVEKPYVFDSEHGKRTLAELFDERGQLIVYHFMFPASWQAGCRSCSFWADGYDGIQPHLGARDVTLVAISKAPLAKLLPFRERMGWSFPWVSSEGSDFNRDFGVSLTPEEIANKEKVYNFGTQPFGVEEAPGISVFARDGDDVLHTYSCYARGLDWLNPAYQLLDLVPKGRDEAGLAHSMAWVRLHDEY
jgi:predicted dithiol-disulfide oxidoreductase (DUF899 family)